MNFSRLNLGLRQRHRALGDFSLAPATTILINKLEHDMAAPKYIGVFEFTSVSLIRICSFLDEKWRVQSQARNKQIKIWLYSTSNIPK